MKELSGRKWHLIYIEQDGAREALSKEGYVQQSVLHRCEGWASKLDVVNLKALIGDPIEQVFKKESHVMSEIERSISEVNTE